ncbi:MAG: hypothetical protein FJX52_13935, partial [Alphaproteobacteria bacterium]|nr:hypothetical protein [Alphaproteobacteria bacterium]
MRYRTLAAIVLAAISLFAADTAQAQQQADQCRDERRKGGQSQQVQATDLIFVQNSVAVPVFYRVRNWEQSTKQDDLPKANAGKCIRVPFPAGFEKLRSISIEISVKADDRDKCNINLPIG